MLSILFSAFGLFWIYTSTVQITSLLPHSNQSKLLLTFERWARRQSGLHHHHLSHKLKRRHMPTVGEEHTNRPLLSQRTILRHMDSSFFPAYSTKQLANVKQEEMLIQQRESRFHLVLLYSFEFPDNTKINGY